MKKMKCNKTLKACVALLLLALALPLQAQELKTKLDSILYNFDNAPEKILVMAHRSAHNHYPENSLAAMKEAIRLGVDIIELDLRKTKDGHLVIMHDATVDRTTDGTGKVSDLTFKELRKLHLLFDGKPTDQQVPTFEEVLDATQDQIMIDIDFKLDDKESVVQTYDLLKKHHAERQVLMFLYDFRYTPKVQELDPSIRIMPRAYSTCDVEAIMNFDDISIVHIDHSYYNDYLMRQMAFKGIRVLVKTMGDLDDMELKNTGSGFGKVLDEKYVNVIQTNLPEELLAYLKSKGRH